MQLISPPLFVTCSSDDWEKFHNELEFLFKTFYLDIFIKYRPLTIEIMTETRLDVSKLERASRYKSHCCIIIFTNTLLTNEQMAVV